jgi:hypothetical protein
MGDPEFRSDEKVILRTSGVYIKSIPFEGILTNKRILLIDRAKNLLPTKEIPLVTINEVESGENAIRDQILTLWVIAKSGETRQMVLTFSRQEGGNRIKERDAWARLIKENASSPVNQVIRKVIPWPEQSPRRTEPATGPKYEIVHSSIRQTAPSGDSRPAETENDGLSPVWRPVTASPVKAVPPSAAVRQVDVSPFGTDVFCRKCGNKVPSDSVFCNRCGSPIAQNPPVPAPLETPTAPPVVQTPVTSPVVRKPAARPLDEEIQSFEPLFEPTPVKIPADALQAAPVEPILKQSLSWDDEVETEPASVPEEQVPEEKPTAEMVIPQIFSTKSTDAAAPAPSSAPPGDTPPPPKPPKGRSLIPGKQTIITAAVVLVVILIIAAGALFVLPMLNSGGTTTPGGETTTPVTITTRPITVGTIIPFEPTPRPVPATGVYVHINYLGGFEGSYGMPDTLITVPGNSGDRLWEVENASGTVQAKFTKQDGSPRKLLVEIYKDGKSLTSGSTTVGHGSVTLSVDTLTGKTAPPLSSGNASVAEPTAAVPKTTPAPAGTASPAVTTTPVTTTTVAANTTTTTP